MHEASIAHGIVETVLRNADLQKACRVESVELEVGELTFLNIEQVTFWIRNGFENTIAQNATLTVRSVPAKIQCRRCHFTGPVIMKDHAMVHYTIPVLTCSQCRDSHVDIVEGKDVVVKQIRIERQSQGEQKRC
ncbi:hydrogenase maturation nickel metallochaperone HypA [bacterium]|nr:hydrogenase maturation nickel metallochaperone HypA [bacterium]